MPSVLEGIGMDEKARQTQHSEMAKTAMNHRLSATTSINTSPLQIIEEEQDATSPPAITLPPTISISPTIALPSPMSPGKPVLPALGAHPFFNTAANPSGVSPIASAASTAPSSPRLAPIRQNSGTTTPRTRPPATTLNIPGGTKSRVSPDGRIAQRDVGSKLVIIMVGLPARGKSYITKKLQRYLSWQQHDVRIFNVGNRRRTAVSHSATVIPGSAPRSPRSSPKKPRLARPASIQSVVDGPTHEEITQTANIMLNGVDGVTENDAQDAELEALLAGDGMDQTAEFFDPANKLAAQVRERVAMLTMNELLDYLLLGGGSVGIFDATNSTLERRKVLFDAIHQREPKLGILFIESVCQDEKLLEANMRLKLRGPDYLGKDPEASYEDFKKRVTAYESAYIPIGQYEEDHGMQYIKMIDVGKKMINFQLSGFLVGGIASYLSTFNLSPRQIWITRHGKSEDNRAGKIGGNSNLTQEGMDYGTVLFNFISGKRSEWLTDQTKRVMEPTPVPQRPGDSTPPYPDLLGDLDTKNFCVWTSMLKRSIQTAHEFDKEEEFDVKNWEMLNELNAGDFEGLTYKEIETRFPEEYAKRAKDKLHYVYPGVGGEGYLQIIARLRDMVREIERIKDHVLIVGHRSVARVLMAYFMDLTRDDIADLDVPLGMLYCIEPKPYGIDFHAYKYDATRFTFDELVGYKPQKETEKGN